MSSDNRPHTTYIDYLSAAEIHIAACKELRKRLKEKDRLYPDWKDREKIRQELYYLSGYVIECAVCYAVGYILEKLNDKADIHLDDILSIDKELVTPWGKQKVTFNKYFKEPEHKIRKKSDFIKEYRKDKKSPKIPILDDINFHNDDELNRKFRRLHENWLPHARYKLSDEIKGLLEEDDLLYEYIQFTINFTNMIRRDFNYRTIK